MYDFSVLRALRRQAGLTLEAVASSSGVSAAVISRLERNLSVAEVPTLFRLGRVFGLTAADLLNLAESRTAQRKTARSYSSGPFAFRHVDFSNVRCFEARAAAGDTVQRKEVHSDVYEVCWVMTGAVVVRLPDETHTLREGEALQFDAVLDHRYEVLEDCCLLILHLTKPKRF